MINNTSVQRILEFYFYDALINIKMIKCIFFDFLRHIYMYVLFSAVIISNIFQSKNALKKKISHSIEKSFS